MHGNFVRKDENNAELYEVSDPEAWMELRHGAFEPAESTDEGHTINMDPARTSRGLIRAGSHCCPTNKACSTSSMVLQKPM